MAVELFGVVADVVPGGFFGGEFVEARLEVHIVVEAIRRDRKAVVFRQNFAERRAARAAKTPWVCIGRYRFVAPYPVAPLNPRQIVFPDEHKRARAHFAASRAMTRRHHGGRGRELEPHRAATTASPDRQSRILRQNAQSMREH